MTADRGPQGQSLGHSHNPRVMPENRGYAGYYMGQLYQDNYRLRTAEELDALPEWSVVVGVTSDGESSVYHHTPAFDWGPGIEDRNVTRWETPDQGHAGLWTSEQLLADVVGPGEHLFVVYRPDVVARRDNG